jgi:FHS family L-fucose permease-like MFS transporter
LAIAGIFLFVAILIYFAHLPEVREATGEALAEPEAAPPTHASIWHYKHLIRGVITEFFYVGAQVGVTSFVIRFTQHALPGTPEKTAANYLWWHLFGFMIGRFAGSAIMKRVAPHRLLGIFSTAAAVCAIIAIFMSGTVAVLAVVLLGFFDSIMFPTIFALSIKNLGVYTKLGSSLLVMSIIGGAIVPAIMGYISDRSSIQAAFSVPLVCYAIVIYFSFRGYNPNPSNQSLNE